MNRARPLLLLVAAAALLGGCRGKIVATAQLTAPGTAEVRFPVTGKKLALWADTDGKWNGSEHSRFDATYEIDVLQNGRAVGHVTCSTMDRDGTTVCGTHSNVMGSHDADCEIALGCRLPQLTSGQAQLRVTGRTGPTVKLVRKMSLNIREE